MYTLPDPIIGLINAAIAANALDYQIICIALTALEPPEGTELEPIIDAIYEYIY